MGAATSTMPGETPTPLFSCFDDCGLCCKGYCCPGCIFGETADIMGEMECWQGCLLMHCCGICTICCVAPGRRTRLREHLKIGEDWSCMDNDCATWICCAGCANCQERRELEYRSLDKEGYASFSS